MEITETEKIRDISEIKKRVEELKREKDAVILAHYYVDGEVKKMADYTGDSFYLAQTAHKIKNRIIVMAGVKFMGESVKILNPDKKVLMAEGSADCPMAHMTTEEEIMKVKEEYDDLAVVSYVNSTAEIKALSDACITSSNALMVISALKEKNILVIPDKNLGNYIREKIKDKNIITLDGCCPVHAEYRKDSLLKLKEEYPDAMVLSHPECRKEILELSDYTGSTSGIIKTAGESENQEFIIFTESGITDELEDLKKDERNKLKKFIFPEGFICADMKRITPETLIETLENEINEVVMQVDLRKKASKPLERMLVLGE